MKIPISLEWKNDLLFALDQTRLPFHLEYLELTNEQAVWSAIKALKIRGAPAISIAGAYAFYMGLSNFVKTHSQRMSNEKYLFKAVELYDYLKSCRPTAVNLEHALSRILVHIKTQLITNISIEKLTEEVLAVAHQIYQEDLSICTALGKNALPLIKEGMGILTHCNAGSIAVSRYGTALAPLHMASNLGRKFTVYVDETRPLLQGSRLTAWELRQSGIDVKLITDNMASWMMSQGKIQMVIVGADRVVANGDVCNKIGTLSVAISAKYFNIPFYVSCPSTTLDLKTQKGSDIEIEERSPEEVLSIKGVPVAEPGTSVCNPAFDVTPYELVSGIITEKGIYPFPYAERLRHDFGK